MRHGIIPGNTNTLWDEVKIVKDQNIVFLLDTMCLDSIEIKSENLPDTITDHFYKKVNDIVTSSVIDPKYLIFK